MHIILYIFQYWESLREKLEKLEVSDDKSQVVNPREASSPECAEDRERSLTGSSDTPSCNGERIVSGQSSSQESVSDGGSSSEGVAQSPSGMASERALLSSFETAKYCNADVEEKDEKGRRTPPGSCLEVVNEIECSIGNTSTELSVGIATEDSCQDKASCETILVLPKPAHGSMHEENCAAQLVRNKEANIPEDCKIITDGLESIDLDEEVEDVFEGNLKDVNAEKEKGDGSSSPPPFMCQPSRNLTVILEELEHCALPE